MDVKTKYIISWILTGIVVVMMVASATDKIIGIIELLSVVLFAIPRTAVLGLLLLSSYLGGGIATHLQHQQPLVFASSIAAFFWITALIRFPEFTHRIKGNLK